MTLWDALLIYCINEFSKLQKVLQKVEGKDSILGLPLSRKPMNSVPSTLFQLFPVNPIPHFPSMTLP